ncbi:hypothetical protein FQA39_LY06731 [Lamprigera yunnana]|nr:hypothetical protein FQA39_LY06731 [Lamprigera yunnana]
MESHTSTDGHTRKRTMKRFLAKTSEGSENKLDVIIKMMPDLKLETQQIIKDQKGYAKEMENLKLRKENAEIRQDLETIKNNVKRIYLEKRKNNIVLNVSRMQSSKKAKRSDAKVLQH